MAKSGGGAGRDTDSAPEPKKKVRLKQPDKGAPAPIVSVNPDAAPKRTALQRGIAGIKKRAMAGKPRKTS